MARTKQVARHCQSYFHFSVLRKSIQSITNLSKESIHKNKHFSRSNCKKPNKFVSNGEKLLTKRCFRPGEKVTPNYQDYTCNQETIIPFKAFVILIYQITREIHPSLRLQESACRALQQAAESYLTDLFANSLLLANHAKRKTVQPKDINLVVRIRGKTNF